MDNIQWPVAEEGYTCEQRRNDAAEPLCVTPKAQWTETPPGSLLQCMDTITVGSVRHYDPMKMLGLHRAFASLKETPESIVRFANKYGLLGIPECKQLVIGSDPLRWRVFEPLTDVPQPGVGYTLGWFVRTRIMRACVKLYDARPEELSERIRFDRAEYSAIMDNWCLLPSSDGPKIKRGDYEAARERILRDQVNGHLTHSVSPVLTKTGIVFLPKSLHAAIWLHFALELAGMKKRDICQQCGRSFWLKSPTQHNARERMQRRDSLYCSPACRTAAWRARKPGATANPSGPL